MIGIYVRLSQEDEESSSIVNQLREGESYAKKANQAYEIYNEGQGISGRKKISERPELDRLLKDIKIDKITTVWFRNQNRLERNSTTFHVFADLAKRKKIKVVFGKKEMDWTDPSNFLQSSIMTAINEYQAELQSYQTKQALLDNAKEGKAFGITPYGYTKDKNGYFIIKEDEAETVKRIYSLSLEGKGTRSIADILNNEGVPTRYNTIATGTISTKNKYTGIVTKKDKKDIKWAGNTVRGIITNPLYKGERRWKNEVFSLPNILDAYYWQRVNDNLKNNLNNKGKIVEHKYLLKGLLECSQCGKNYYGRTRINKKDNYYMCSSKRHKYEKCTNRSINIDVLDSLIWETMFVGDTLYRQMIKTISEGDTKQRQQELLSHIDLNRNELKSLADQRKRMVNAVVKGVLKEDEVGGERLRITRAENDCMEKLIKDEEELYQLENEINLLQDLGKDLEIDMLDELPVTHQWYLDHPDIFKTIKPLLRSSQFNPSFNKRRKLIRKYIRRILISYDDEKSTYSITIKFNIPLRDRILILDSNYIGVFDLNENELMAWLYQDRRHFTDEKIDRTIEFLESYKKP